VFADPGQVVSSPNTSHRTIHHLKEHHSTALLSQVRPKKLWSSPVPGKLYFTTLPACDLLMYHVCTVYGTFEPNNTCRRMQSHHASLYPDLWLSSFKSWLLERGSMLPYQDNTSQIQHATDITTAIVPCIPFSALLPSKSRTLCPYIDITFRTTGYDRTPTPTASASCYL
jgi:hypothetical protein